MAASAGQGSKYRLVTRSDFDGLVCAVLLREIGMVDEVSFAHPKDMQDGLVELSETDVTTNLPFVPGVHMAFDHHASEAMRVNDQANHIIDAKAPSAARVVYDYFGGASAFPNIAADMMEAVDRSDAALLGMDDVTDPQGWILLGFIMDARTGLGRFRDFRLSNYHLMMKLIDLCRDHTIDEIFNDPDVRERLDIYNAHKDKFEEQLRQCSTVYDNLVVLDLRNEDVIYAGNRFRIYTVFPDCNISMHVMRGKDNVNTVFAIGKSIFKRDSRTDVGQLCLAFRGGGHRAAGTCQVSNENGEKVREALIARITMDG